MSDESILDRVSIAAPCHANWNEMTGDEQVRHCEECKLNVYNISAMTTTEAETLISEKEGRLCVRYYRRADGTIMTKDCPVGLTILHKKRLMRRAKSTGIAAAVALITIAGTFVVSSAEQLEKCPIFDGQDKEPPENAQPLMGKPQPIDMGEMEMGDVATPIPPPPPKHIKGKVKLREPE